MRSATLPPAVLAMVLDACESEPALLNSERIEQRFGSYGITVLPGDPGLRRASLFSGSGDDAVCRTFAVARFAAQAEGCFTEEHAKVMAGNSIGAIFRSHGWDVHKQTIYIGRLELPARKTLIGDLMRIGNRGVLALHVYQLLLARDELAFEYATIIEAHHPEYLSEQDLRNLYDFDVSTALSPHSVSDLVLLVLGNER